MNETSEGVGWWLRQQRGRVTDYALRSLLVATRRDERRTVLEEMRCTGRYGDGQFCTASDVEHHEGCQRCTMLADLEKKELADDID